MFYKHSVCTSGVLETFKAPAAGFCYRCGKLYILNEGSRQMMQVAEAKIVVVA